MAGTAVVTGAFSHTGKYIARRLLDCGVSVRTLTNHPDRPDPFGGLVEASPYTFDEPARLAGSLRGADVLYNTYWVRFPKGGITFDTAVANTRILLAAARDAGVGRVVQITVSNPSETSPLAYYRGKAAVERAVRECGLSYAIVRPTLVFSLDDILINNMAWLLRRFPAFAIPGSGDYAVQPVYVEDLAEIVTGVGGRSDNTEMDAAGPEVLTFNQLLAVLRKATRSRARLMHVPPSAALLAARFLGLLVRDVVLTRYELDGLSSNLLISHNAPTGRTSFSEWLRDNGERLGRRYASELDRHFR